MTQREDRFFAITAPGFETICQQELSAAGLENPQVAPGGVEFAGGLRELYLANLWSRTATRILVRFGEFPARDFPTLYRRLIRLPWGRFIKPDTGCEVRVSCHHSRLMHSGRVAETTRESINKALGRSEVSGNSQQKIFLRLDEDRCQVSIDSSGELLHRRGYRVAKVAAPLRENLAAGCLLALGFDGSRALIDAMCGSGTFAIEAGLIALRRAPGLSRSFAFMHWPKYRQGLWQQLLQEARRQECGELPAAITAVDSNPLAVAAAGQNLQEAGLAGWIRLENRRFQELEAPETGGLIICNPPYGERLGRNASLQALYRDLGRVYAKTFSHWQGAIVCPENALVETTGIRFVPRLQFSNGGIPVSLLKKP